MIVFAAQHYFQRYAAQLAGIGSDAVLGRLEVMRYPNKEICAAILENVEGKQCLLIGTIAPPDSQLAGFLMLADALKRNGARSICAFLPYLAYARQDKFASGQSGGIGTVGSLFRAVGINSVITIDLHSELDKKLIGLPIVSLMPSHLFVPELQNLGWRDATVAAPDEGGVRRNEELAAALGIREPIVRLVKKRNSITHLGMVGEPGPRVIVCDDILDSGRTLVSACNMLRQNGVEEIAVAVTHGLFTGEIWKELFGVGVASLFVSDSCPGALRTEDTRIKVLSINPLLPTALAAARKEFDDEFITS